MIIVSLHAILAITFSLGPIFEGPDEIEHYRYIRTMAASGSLPEAAAQPRGEYFQAPLYYVLNLPLAWLLPGTDFETIAQRLNPYYPYEIAIPGNDNKNLYLHTDAEAFPYSGSSTALAVHVMRLLAIALQLATLGVAIAIFRRLWPERPDYRLLALAVLAFNPQFTYLASVISNDRLLTLLASLILWLGLKIQHDGLSRWRAVLLGTVFGLALITKISALYLAFPIGLALLLSPGLWRSGWRYLPLSALITLVIIAPWYLRNLALYGDATASNILLLTWKADVIREGSLAWDVAWTRLPFLYQTFWARFGGGAIAVSDGINRFFDLLSILACVGLLAKIADKIRTRQLTAWRPALLAATFVLAWCGVAIYQAAKVWSGNTGRYLLTGMFGWSILIAWGLTFWTFRRWRTQQIVSAIGACASVATICTYGYFVPAYTVTPVPSTIERPLAIRYGDVAELIGMSPAAPRARPGEVVRITLYWRALRAGSESLQSFLHTIDPAVIKRDSLPATGNLLASDWYPGRMWAEAYDVRIPVTAPAQAVYLLSAGLYDPPLQLSVPATDFNGVAITPIIGRIAIHGDVVEGQPSYFFGSVIGLVAPRLTVKARNLEGCFQWVSLAATSVDYTVYIHIVTGDKTENLSDRQPKAGQYPTSAWFPGEAIDDCFSLPLPEGLPEGWKLAIGLYRPEDGQRLPIVTQQRTALPNNEIVLTP